MKSIKIIFTVASIALLIAVGCFLAYLFLPDNAAKTEAVVEKAEAEVSQDLPIEEQAKIEVERFKRDYGMEIATDEMIKELHIRKEYEEKSIVDFIIDDDVHQYGFVCRCCLPIPIRLCSIGQKYRYGCFERR